MNKDRKRGITQAGQQALGCFVRQARQDDRVFERVKQWLSQKHPHESCKNPISQKQFARWISDNSIADVSPASLNRLERGQGRYGPGIGILIAIQKLDFLELPDGSKCSLDTLGAILIGQLDPLSDTEKDSDSPPEDSTAEIDDPSSDSI